jgi:hypothetical protein
VQGVAYVFGSFQFSPTERLLLDDGRPAQLGSHALGILIALVGSARETVSNAEIRLTRDYRDFGCGDTEYSIHSQTAAVVARHPIR